MATPENPHKKVILSLIKDDILHTNFISGLRELGVDAGDHYTLRIPEAIIKLMGFGDEPKTDAVFDTYFDLIKGIMPCNAFWLKKTLDTRAEEIYRRILALKINFDRNENQF